MYEEESFCKPAIEMETFLCDLGAKNIVELGTSFRPSVPPSLPPSLPPFLFLFTYLSLPHSLSPSLPPSFPTRATTP